MFLCCKFTNNINDIQVIVYNNTLVGMGKLYMLSKRLNLI